MIELKVSTGEITNLKKIKIITGDSRVEATNSEQIAELSKIIVEGEAFVFGIDDKGVAMFPMDSSTISHLGWFNDEMFITFKGKNGFTMYGYTGVSDTRFADLVNAKSIGRRLGLMKAESLKTFVRFF